jgi:hypothetical protein
MIPSTQSTRPDGQYFSTVDRHASTFLIPPASAGQFGDHFELLGAVAVVVVVTVEALVVVVAAFVVVVALVVVVG